MSKANITYRLIGSLLALTAAAYAARQWPPKNSIELSPELVRGLGHEAACPHLRADLGTVSDRAMAQVRCTTMTRTQGRMA